MEIKRYRKRPVAIEAVLLTKENWKEVLLWCDAELLFVSPFGDEYDYLEIHTPEGKMHAKYGDYIIRGIEGEFYPCRASIFEKSYEEVE